MIGRCLTRYSSELRTVPANGVWTLGSLLGDRLVARMDEYYWLAINYQSGLVNWYRAETERGCTTVDSWFVEIPEEISGPLTGGVLLFDKGTFSTFLRYLNPDDASLIALKNDLGDVFSEVGAIVAASLAVPTMPTGASMLEFWMAVERISQAIIQIWGPDEVAVFFKSQQDIEELKRLADAGALQVREAELASLVG